MAYATIDQLRMYLPQVAELGVQRVTISGAPTGGTFTLAYEGVSAAPLAYNATATQLQTALRALSALGSNVKASGRPGGPYVVSFQGTLATDAGPLTLAANNLTGGSAPSVLVAAWSDAILQQCLDNATDMVRATMRALLADPAFDYGPFGPAAAKVVRGYASEYMRLPPYQLGTVTTVAWQSGYNPSSFTPLVSTEWEELGDGRLYRGLGWAARGSIQRYQITAVWGYGSQAPQTLQEVTLELSVNIWRTRDKGGFADTVGVSGSGAIVQVSGLTNLQKQILVAERDKLINVGV